MHSYLCLVLLQLVGLSYQGAVYTRWGRTTCGLLDDELVYDGVAGGTYWNIAGGAANYVCLTRQPEWGNYDDALNGGGEMFGTEYQTQTFDPFQTGNDMMDENVPCVVCGNLNVQLAVMIPGRLSCFSGWQKAYSGYLMSSWARNDHGRTEYICVDGDPEAGIMGDANQDGALLYSVEGRCGSLPCGPYVEGRELTCVVCLK